MPKNKTGLQLKASIFALGLLSLPLAASAAGVGKLTVLSALGQPLRVEIELSASKEELNSLVAKLGTPDQFRQQGIEYASSLGTVALSIEKRANGQPYVKMSSERPVNDPFLDVLIEISWSAGRLLREYTFLLDPPELSARKSAPVAVPEVRVSGPGVSNAPVRTEPVAVEPARSAVSEPTKPEAAPAKKGASPKVAQKPDATSSEPPKSVTEPAKEAAPKEGEAGSHEVRKGETLGKIAGEHAYEGVSLDQMLVAIFNNNKQAFSGDNMNRLKAGKILAIPSKEEAGSVTQGEARKTIAVHSANFDAYRSKLATGAASAPAGPAAQDQAASGKIAPKVEDKAPTPKAGGDTVVISKTELGKSGKPGKAGSEDRIAAERAVKEEKARVAELEKNVAELKRLNDAQSKTLAEAEKRASAQKAGAEKAAAEKAAAEKLAAEKKVAADKAAAEKLAAEKLAAEKAAADKAAAEKATAEKVAAEKLAAEKAAADKAAAEKAAAEKLAAEKAAAEKSSAPAEAAKPVEVAAAPAAPAEVKPEAEAKPESAPPPPRKKPVMPPPEPEPEPSFIEANGPLVFGGGGLLAALLGFLGFREWKRRKTSIEPNSQFGEPSALSSVFGSTGGQSVDTRNISIGDNFSQSSLSGGDASAGVDPVAEAEVYMAYGRDAQAEEILLEAMKHEPNRHAIHLKLLELYAARRSSRPFEEVARDLKQQTGGNGAEWDKAVVLGKSIDPDNPLYGGNGAPMAPPVSTGAFEAGSFGTSTVIMPPGQLAKMAAGELPVSTLQLDAPPLAEAESHAETLVLDSPPAVEAPALDFDLDLGAPDGAASAEAPAVLDFDLDLGSEASQAAEVPQEVSLDLNVDAPAATALPEINFDLELPSMQPQAAAEPAAAPAMDFDFNLDAPSSAEAAPSVSAAAPADVDFGGVSLDLEAPSATFAEMPADLGAAVDAEENPEVATKLELAQAYEEMGDKEGMRELLQEVLAEGSAMQQEIARNKLAQHGLS